jgi:two-component system, cell cycle sensor histidine kinase PleC
MSEITAEMIARGRSKEARSPERRRLSDRVRETREQLMSAGAGNVVFDLELLRLYAEGRKAAFWPQVILCLAVAAMAMVWAPPAFVALWLLQALSAVGVAGGAALRFLYLIARAPVAHPSRRFAAGGDRKAISVKSWQARFVFAEGYNGMIWASFAVLMTGVSNPMADPVATPWAATFVVVAFILAAATHTVVTAFVPAAAAAAMIPIALSLLLFMRPVSLHGPVLPLTLLVLGALLYFAALARRIYVSQLDSLAFQTEKDVLIHALEQARANSDEARRRAEEASLAKSRFLATMSHELRTPLNAILGFSEVMKTELFGSHTVAAYRDYSGDIHASGEHLLTLINEILDLSRVEAGRYELKEEPVPLTGVIDDCRHLLTLRARKRGVALSAMVEPDMPGLWADERAVRQIVLNLLTNAIKFTPQGGQVAVKVGWTKAGGQYFSVKDTGPGIPDEEIPLIMSSFGRGSLALQNACEGSGLGLPIVKGLVELHGGVFTLRSKMREGTEVVVVFPPERVMNAPPHLSAGPAVRQFRGAA